MRHFLTQRPHVSFYLISYPSYHSGSNRVAGVFAEKRYEFILLHFHQRQFLCHSLQHREPHLQSRSDVSAHVFPFVGHKVIRDSRPGIDDQEVLVGAQTLRAHSRSQTVLSECLRRVVAVHNRYRRVVIEKHKMLRTAMKRIHYRRFDIHHRGNDRIRDVVQVKQTLHVRR